MSMIKMRKYRLPYSYKKTSRKKRKKVKEVLLESEKEQESLK